MRQSEIDEYLARLSRQESSESNRYGVLAVLVLDNRDAERLMFGFLRADGSSGDRLILDVPGYEKPVVLESDRILAIDIPSQQISDEVLALGFLRGIPTEERREWLEAYLHTALLDLCDVLRGLFPGMTHERSLAIRSCCRYDALRSDQWTVIVRPSALHSGGPVWCRVFIPDDGTMEFGGLSQVGALWGIQAPDSILEELGAAQKSVTVPREWEQLPFQKIANATDKSLSVIVYDCGDSLTGYVFVSRKVFAPAS